MGSITSLLLGATFEETLVNIVGFIGIIEFIGCIFGLIGNIHK